MCCSHTRKLALRASHESPAVNLHHNNPKLTQRHDSGCTTQVCLFRDSYEPLTATGLAIYGLSTDSPKANTTFKTKQNLPYSLLCDPGATLIKAIGFKKAPKGTQRGVFVVDKEGKVLAVEAGGPAATVEVVKGLVENMGGDGEGEEKEVEDEKAAETAAEVADVAKGLDGTPS